MARKDIKRVKIRERKRKVEREDKITEVKEVKGIDIATLITNQQAEYDKAIGARTTWIANQVKWFKKRFGIRPKKTFPWPGASNLHLPLQDKNIRKLKPDYVNVLWNTVPICTFQPVGPEDFELAERVEWFFDWLLRNVMNVFTAICLSADKTLARGFCIAKTVYRKETEPTTIVLLRKELEEQQQQENASRQGMNVQTIDFMDLSNYNLFQELLVKLYGFDPEDENDVAKMNNIASAFYSGAEAIEFTVDEIVKDSSEVIILNPERVVVPVDTLSILDLEDARWIDHTYEVAVEEFLKDKLSGKWDKEIADVILRNHGVENDDIQDLTSKYNKSKVQSDRTMFERRIDYQTDLREGISPISQFDDHITIHEVFMWYDSDGDGIEERHVLNYSEECMDGALRFIKYPYRMKKWPFVKIPFEIIDEGHYSSRGITEITNPLASALNMQHNSKINRQTLGTAMMFWYVPGKVNPNNVRFIPGQGIPVPAPGNQNFGIVQSNVGAEISFEREEQILKAWAEEYIASTDFGIASAVNPTGTSKARTATEIQGISQASAGVRRLDILIWKMAWAEIFCRVYQLEMQFGPESRWTAVDGSGKPAELTKEEVAGHYNIVPAGELTTSDPVLEAQKAQARYQQLAGNPMIRQDELLREVLFKDNPRIAKRLLKTPEEMAKEAEQAKIDQAKAFEMQIQLELAKRNKSIPQQREVR